MGRASPRQSWSTSPSRSEASGYDTTLVSDAHTTEDLSQYGLPPADRVIAHTNMYWSWHAAPGRSASVVETAGVNFDASEHDISS